MRGEPWIILFEGEGSPKAPPAMIHRTPSGHPSAGSSSAESASVSPNKTKLLRSSSGVKRLSSLVLLHRRPVTVHGVFALVAAATTPQR
jgi:hypothetical protein